MALNGTARVLAIVRAGASCPDPITTLWKDGHARRLDLQPLSEPEIAQLLVTTLEGHVERATVHSLYRRSRGNPLYTTELLRGAIEERSLRLDQGVWHLRAASRPPQRLNELLSERVAGLARGELALLELVALAEPLELEIASWCRLRSPGAGGSCL
jgi:predicted ATPase